MRVPFAVHSYVARSLPLSAQRLVNCYAEVNPPDSKMPVVVYGTPGLKSWGSAGNGPIRGMHDYNGTLAVVSGPTLFTVDSGGSATSRGTVQGSDAAAPMASSDTELAVVSNSKGWTWDGTTFAQITDGDFLTPGDVTWQDGYFIFSEEGEDRFFISDLNDATAYDATNRAQAEGSPDDIVATISDHRELWLFGSKTTEVWYNAATVFPFERINHVFIQRGCLARASVLAMDNTIYWLGDDRVVYRADGYTPLRISTHAIETALEGYAAPEDATAFTYTQAGHKFYGLNFAEGTWVYDIATGLWHERQGYGLTRWRGNNCVEIYGKRLVGDYANGNIYELDLDTYQDNSGNLVRTLHSAPVHGETFRTFVRRFQVEFEGGVGLTSGQGSDPQAMLSWSDDGGHSFSNEHWADIGEKGKYGTRAIWRRLGQFRERVFRLQVSDPVKFVVIAMDLNPEVSA